MPISSSDTLCQGCTFSRSFSPSLDAASTPLSNTSLNFASDEVIAGNACIASLREAIQDLENAIQDLQTRKKLVEARLAQQISYLAPIQRLPDDILLEIMEITCEVHDPLVRHHLPEGTQMSFIPEARAPWSIAAVSRRWRALTLCSPQLWARVEYGIDSDSLREDLGRLRLSLQVERSNPRPLIVRLAGSGKLFSSLLGDHAHRIQDLNVDFKYFRFDDEAYRHRSLNLSSLKKLRIAQFTQSGQMAFHNTPMVTDLSLKWINMSESPQNTVSTAAWTALTSLQLISCSFHEPRDLFEVLRSAQHLTLLKVVPGATGPWTRGVPLAAEELIVLPHLKALSLGFEVDRNMCQGLIQRIRCPNITHLEMSCVNMEGVEGIVPLIDVVNSAWDGSTNHITTFSILFDNNNNDSLIYFSETLKKILRKLPSLRRLRVQGNLYFEIGSFLDSLSSFLDPFSSFQDPLSSLHEEPTQWCPQLEEFHLGMDKQYVSPTHVKAFCDSRRNVLGPDDDGAFGTDRDGTFTTIFLSNGTLNNWLKDDDTVRWAAEAQQTGLLKYPAPRESWVEIFDSLSRG